MSLEDRIRGKNASRILPQWRRHTLIQRQRMWAQVFGAATLAFVGISRFLINVVPLWLQVMCFVLLPMSVLGFFADRRIYLARQRDVEELEKLVESKSCLEK
jgi:hypothetical protein